MSVPTKCSSCGHQYISNAYVFADISNLHLKGNTETCPECGGISNLQDGTYDFVGETISAFRMASKENLILFKEILDEVKSGDKDISTAKLETKELGQPLHNIIDNIENHPVTASAVVAVLLAILTAVLTIYMWSKDSEAAQIESQAEAKVHQEQIEIAKRQADALEKIADEIRNCSDISETISKMSPQTSPRTRPTPRQKPDAAAMNRHERRKAKALEKKKNNPN